MKSYNYIYEQIKESIEVKSKIYNNEQIVDLINSVVKKTIEAYQKNKKILIAGNGGSAADSQHFAAELIGRFKFERQSLNAIALSTDTSIITSIGNDYSFSQIFSRQIESQGNAGDIFFAISTSGNSDNILKALEQSKKNKMFSVGLTGQSGGKMKELCDICICIPSNDTARIQESHILIEHIICSEVEKFFAVK
jgi:D-sedoheptulose 7-phosphate isomerase